MSRPDFARLRHIWTESFGQAAGGQRPYEERVGTGNVRTHEESGEAVGVFALLPFAQYFGGRAVPSGGIGGVAVLPTHRGRGIARAMMRDALLELAGRGIPLAALYPATQPIYRSVGYEHAGVRWETRIPVDAFPHRERALPVRVATDADQPSIRALYSAFAAQRPGWLDRHAFNWDRAHHPTGGDSRIYMVEDEGELAAYAVVQRQAVEMAHHDLHLTDVAWRSPQGLRRLLTLLADHGSLDRTVVLRVGATDPLLLEIPEQRYTVRVVDHWMLRIVDVAGALMARGYPVRASGELHLAVRDTLLPTNDGRFVLRVEEGRATVEPGGAGSVALDISTLAPLFSGHHSLLALRSVGRAEATDGDLEVSAALFAGPPPSLPDMF
jgi:predicted acetyltransferase